jgi:hypothetical protein
MLIFPGDTWVLTLLASKVAYWGLIMTASTFQYPLFLNLVQVFAATVMSVKKQAGPIRT